MDILLFKISKEIFLSLLEKKKEKKVGKYSENEALHSTNLISLVHGNITFEMSYIPLTNSQSPASQAGRGKKKEPWLVNSITRAIPRSQNLQLYLRNEQSRVYVRTIYTADQKFGITCSVKFNIKRKRKSD